MSPGKRLTGERMLLASEHPSSDLEGVVHKLASYAGAGAMSKELSKTLPCAQVEEWEEMGMRFYEVEPPNRRIAVAKLARRRGLLLPLRSLLPSAVLASCSTRVPRPATVSSLAALCRTSSPSAVLASCSSRVLRSTISSSRATLWLTSSPSAALA